jgi:polysaccharide biosynthesis protein PslH
VRLTAPASWSNVTQAIVKGAYERAYRSAVDRVWVVAETERRAARWFAGMSVVDVLPNGVDADYYRAADEPEIPNSAVFWGRLDFGPNVEALNWFCRRVWPAVRRAVPDARFTIIGFQPTEEIRRLAASPGITVMPDVMDLRPLASRHALVVLPFVSGGGIKNKLLEAAALGKPIVCTPHACKGLRSSATELPLVKAITPHDWVAGMLALWTDAGRRRQLGADARQWVVRCHSWSSTAREALDALEGARRCEDGECRSIS